MIKMSLSDAAQYQDAFDAVLDGTCTTAQAIEVDAIVNAVHRYMQDVGAAAGRFLDARTNTLAAVGDAKRAEVARTFDGADPKPPRLLFDATEERVLTPAESDAALVAREGIAGLAEKRAALQEKRDRLPPGADATSIEAAEAAVADLKAELDAAKAKHDAAPDGASVEARAKLFAQAEAQIAEAEALVARRKEEAAAAKPSPPPPP